MYCNLTKQYDVHENLTAPYFVLAYFVLTLIFPEFPYHISLVPNKIWLMSLKWAPFSWKQEFSTLQSNKHHLESEL